MSKTTTQKIESVQEQIRQLENQKKKLIQEQRERERKARTKRLIERGAILESLIPEADVFTNDQIKTFLEKTIQTDYAHKALREVTAIHDTPGTAKAAGAAQNPATSGGNTAGIATGQAG